MTQPASQSPTADPAEPLGLLARLGSLFRTYAIPEDSIPVPGPFQRDDRNGFTFMVPEEWGSDDGGVSSVRLLEDGQHLGPAGVTHDDVRSLGRGRYSHWGVKIYFSTSDNTDPNTNGRTYSVVPPAGWRPTDGGSPWQARKTLRSKGDPLSVEWTVQEVSKVDLHPVDGLAYRFPLRARWPSDEDSFSTLLLLEDGKPLGPPHQSRDDVATLGKGRFAHLGQDVIFSTSDGSDPRRNGYSYGWAHAHAFVMKHAARPPQPDQGHAWTLGPLPREWPSDADGGLSKVRLLEDGKLLGPPGCGHDAIRNDGHGAYSHWGDTLYFSTSDGSDPNTNGRTYTVVWLGDED